MKNYYKREMFKLIQDYDTRVIDRDCSTIPLQDVLDDAVYNISSPYGGGSFKAVKYIKSFETALNKIIKENDNSMLLSLPGANRDGSAVNRLSNCTKEQLELAMIKKLHLFYSIYGYVYPNNINEITDESNLVHEYLNTLLFEDKSLLLNKICQKLMDNYGKDVMAQQLQEWYKSNSSFYSLELLKEEDEKADESLYVLAPYVMHGKEVYNIMRRVLYWNKEISQIGVVNSDNDCILEEYAKRYLKSDYKGGHGGHK